MMGEVSLETSPKNKIQDMINSENSIRHTCNVLSSTESIAASYPSFKEAITGSPCDFVTKVKQINSQSDLISMSSFAGSCYLIVRSSVYII